MSHLEAEWQELDESIGAVSDSVKEEIERKQSEALAAAAGIDAVERASARREDEFFADELKRHDAEVAKFYQEHPQP